MFSGFWRQGYSPVPLPAAFLLRRADSSAFAFGRDSEALRVNATTKQGTLNTARASLSKRQVVAGRTTRIGIALQLQLRTGIFLQQRGSLCQARFRIGTQYVAVCVEQDLLDGRRDCGV